MDDLDDEQRQAGRAKALAKALAFREKEDLRWILSKEQGRRFLHGLLESAGGLHDPIGPGADGLIALGRRDLALRVYRLIREVSGVDMLALMAKDWHIPPEHAR